MSRPHLLGNLPRRHSSLDRQAACKVLNVTKKELHKAYNNWIQIFRIDGSSLTFEQYMAKLKEAKISPFQVGNYSEDYHLSRYDDIGPYTNESCRFILKVENLAEAKREPPYRRMLNKYGATRTREMMSENAKRSHQRRKDSELIPNGEGLAF